MTIGQRWREERGYSLVEVMAATVISLVIVGAGFTTLTSSNKATQVNDLTAQTQQNARLAMELISRDVKLAGFGMTGPVGACNSAIVPADNTPAGADSGPDSVSLVVPITSSVAPLWTLANPVPGAAPITLQAGAVGAMQAAGLTNGSTISIGGAATATAAVPNPGANQIPLASALPPSAAFPIGMPVYLLQCITYQVIGPPDPNNVCGGNAPCLVRGVTAGLNCNVAASPCVPLTDGIEDLQLTYACDGCNVAVNGGVADGVVDDQNASNSFDQADFISNNNWATPPMIPTNIRLVQISIVARQPRVDQGFGEGQAPLRTSTATPIVVGDHNPINGVFAAGDFNLQNPPYQQLRRRVLTRTVEARNLRL